MICHKAILKGFSKLYSPHPTEGLQCKKKYPTFPVFVANNSLIHFCTTEHYSYRCTA